MKFKYKKYTYIVTFSVMLLGMMLFSTKPSSNPENRVDKADSKQPETEVSSQIETTSPKTAVSSGALKKDAYPEVNSLIRKYFDALIKIDEKAISDCVDKIEFVGIDKLPKRVKEIESVDGLVCYTIDGPEEDSYIVFVYNEVKFKNISTKSTALDGYYVKKDETGTLKIILSPLSYEVQKIIDEDTKRKDVVALIEDVNTKLKNEIKSDKQLATLLKRMRETKTK